MFGRKGRSGPFFVKKSHKKFLLLRNFYYICITNKLIDMRTLNIKENKIEFKSTTFRGNGKRIPFDTSYVLRNEKTGGEMKFDFSSSTGSEWDPKTLWIYKSTCGKFEFILSNEDVTPAHANAYLQAKLNK